MWLGGLAARPRVARAVTTATGTVWTSVDPPNYIYNPTIPTTEPMILLKLGGSTVTRKDEMKAFDAETSRRLAREAAGIDDLVIVHGAGSYGHILAHKHALHLGLKDPGQLRAVAEVQRDVRELNLLLMNDLIEAGVNAVSVPASLVATYSRGSLIAFDPSPFRAFLDLSLTPVTFGDVVMDEEWGAAICSGDDLMLELARALKPERAVFAVDVDGIFTRKGGEATMVEELRSDADLDPREDDKVVDVTGGMHRKAEVMLAMAKVGVDAYAVNGREPGRVAAALRGEEVVGTSARGHGV